MHFIFTCDLAAAVSNCSGNQGAATPSAPSPQAIGRRDEPMKEAVNQRIKGM
jgi:hypothetical protein